MASLRTGPFPVHLVAQVVGERPRDSGARELVKPGKEIDRREETTSHPDGLRVRGTSVRTGRFASTASTSSQGLEASSAQNQSRCMSCHTCPASCAIEKR